MYYYWRICTCVVLLSSDSFLYASDEQEEKHRGIVAPVSSAVMPKITPGKVMAKKQREELSRERFATVLGTDIVDQWSIDWATLGDDSLAFDNTEKRSCLNFIIVKMGNLKTNLSTDFYTLYGEVSMIKRQMDIVYLERLENVAVAYFSTQFPGAEVRCIDKGAGVQLGTKAIVKLLSGEERKYHVKTHSEGRLATKSTAAKRVNPRELLAYKVLEHLGFGCETHFFQRSTEDVYIATLDAGHGGTFNVFAKATDRQCQDVHNVYGQSLWGRFQILDRDPTKNNWQDVEDKLQGDESAQNFVIQMSALDMVSRILRLHDLLNNPDNFGFFLKKDASLPLVRVIDFRVADEQDSVVTFAHFGGFLEGNGLYNYVGAHESMRYCIHDRSRELRVKTARHILTQGPLAETHHCMERAYGDVREYITGAEVFVDYREKMMNQLDQFYNNIQKNVSYFTEGLQAWTPEEDRKRTETYKHYTQQT